VNIWQSYKQEHGCLNNNPGVKSKKLKSICLMARGLAGQLAEYRAKLNMSDMSKISIQCISNHIYVTTGVSYLCCFGVLSYLSILCLWLWMIVI